MSAALMSTAPNNSASESYFSARFAEIRASIQRYKEEQEALFGEAEAVASPKKPTAMEFERLFEHKYVIGVSRRTQYDAALFPVALVGLGAGTKATLRGYEGHGSLWRFIQIEIQSGYYTVALECCEYGETSTVLTHSLELSRDPAQAAEFAIEPYSARHGPFDIGVKIRSIDGRTLGCNEHTRAVALLTDEQAEERDVSGNYVWNIAWECTPEMAVPADEETEALDKLINETPDYSEL